MWRLRTGLKGVAALVFILSLVLAEGREDSYIERRMEMVELLKGSRYGIKDERVLQAMAATPRHEFVREGERSQAYEDSPLPIGFGQTISQPFIVAFMTEALELKSTDRVLEVGTGSGYQAAVLSGLVAEVCSIEIVEALAKRAAETLTRLGYENVKTKFGDGYKGWPAKAPFDAVIVTCAPDQVPQELVDQLKEGGRMVIPVGKAGAVQELYVMEKKGGRIKSKAVMPVRFVPMTREGEK